MRSASRRASAKKRERPTPTLKPLSTGFEPTLVHNPPRTVFRVFEPPGGSNPSPRTTLGGPSNHRAGRS